MPDDLFQQVLDAARALGVTEIEAIVSEETQALTRFANNAIHQNVSERSTQLSVRAGDRRANRARHHQPAGPGRHPRRGGRGDRDHAADEPDADLLPLAEPAAIDARWRGISRVPPQATPGSARAGRGGGDRAVSRRRARRRPASTRRTPSRFSLYQFARRGGDLPGDDGALLDHRDGGR